MADLLTGPLALVARQALLFVGGWLAAQGLAVWDPAAGTLTIYVDNASALLAGMAATVIALVWRKAVVAVGGRT